MRVEPPPETAQTSLTDAEYAAVVPQGRCWYGPGYYKFTERDHGWSNRLFARVLMTMFRPSSVMEFGCGTGAMLAELEALGVQRVLGVDGSPHCLAFVERAGGRDLASRVTIHDMGKPWGGGMPKVDLAVSIEMLEHVEPEGAAEAVKTICSASDVVVVTASPPEVSHANPLHLNEQPWEWWGTLFMAQGMMPDLVATAALQGMMRVFARLHEVGRCPVVPQWYTMHYIGVFARGGKAAIR